MNISKICESKYFADPLLESLYGHIRCLVSVVVPSSSCGWHPYDKQNRFQTMGQNHTYCPLNKNNKKPLYDFKYMYKCINICHQIIYLCNFQEKKYLSKQQQPNHLLTHFPPQKKHLRSPKKLTSKRRCGRMRLGRFQQAKGIQCHGRQLAWYLTSKRRKATVDSSEFPGSLNRW